MACPAFQFVAIAPCSVIGHYQKEILSFFFAISLQVFVYIHKTLPEFYHLLDEESQLSPTILIGVMQQFTVLVAFSWTIKYVHVLHSPPASSSTILPIDPIKSGTAVGPCPGLNLIHSQA